MQQGEPKAITSRSSSIQTNTGS